MSTTFTFITTIINKLNDEYIREIIFIRDILKFWVEYGPKPSTKLSFTKSLEKPNVEVHDSMYVFNFYFEEFHLLKFVLVLILNKTKNNLKVTLVVNHPDF